MKPLDKKLLEQVDNTLNVLNKALNETMNQGSADEIKLWKSLQTAIELIRDTAHIKDYLNSEITISNQFSKETFDFMNNLQKLAIETAKLNFDSKLSLLSNKSYENDPVLSTLAVTISLMLEELEHKIIPKYYFEKIFDLLEMPAVLTDMSGKINVTSDLWKQKTGYSISQHGQIDEIIPGAIKAMTHIKNIENSTLIKNAIIISSDGSKIEGFDVKVKHLFTDRKTTIPEGFLFVCVPSL